MSGTPAAASPAEDGPERAAGLLCEGVAHEEADRLDAALQAYLAAHRAEPNNAEAIFRAGSAARRLGIVDGAERLLTRSIELAPGSLAPRMELAQLLSDEERYREAERHLLAVAEAAPEAGVAHRLLGLLLHALHRFDEAAAAFERELAVDQENARAWLLLGKALASSTTRFEEAPRAFEKALEHARGALGMLREVALHYFRARDFQTALGYLEQEAALLPAHSSSEPLVHFYLATCLRECGHHERADAELRLALAEVDWQIDTAEPAHAMIYAALKARILHAFGDRDTAIAIHRQVAEMLEPGDFVYPGRCFLPDNDRRIERLRRVVRGRDVAVLLQGPSIAGLEPEMPGLADLDLCYATVNKFPAVEVRLLAPIGRCFDVLMTGNPSDLANFWPQYRDFLQRPDDNVLIASRFAASGLDPDELTPDGFAARYDERLLYYATIAFAPPSPLDPLNFLPGNTLSVLLPLLVLAQPRRIFLFGADGGASPQDSDKLYFFSEESRDEGERRRLREVQRRLLNEARECDLHCDIDTIALSHLFRVPVPPIWNCCPHSGYGLWPKISIAEGVAMLRDGAPGGSAG